MIYLDHNATTPLLPEVVDGIEGHAKRHVITSKIEHPATANPLENRKGWKVRRREPSTILDHIGPSK